MFLAEWEKTRLDVILEKREMESVCVYICHGRSSRRRRYSRALENQAAPWTNFLECSNANPTNIQGAFRTFPWFLLGCNQDHGLVCFFFFFFFFSRGKITFVMNILIFCLWVYVTGMHFKRCQNMHSSLHTHTHTYCTCICIHTHTANLYTFLSRVKNTRYGKVKKLTVLDLNIQLHCTDRKPHAHLFQDIGERFWAWPPCLQQRWVWPACLSVPVLEN